MEIAGPRQYSLRLPEPPIPSKLSADDIEETAPYAGEAFIHVRRYKAPNWATTEGVAKKRRAIERKGLPRMKFWRMITLTLNRDLFECCPLAGYLQGKDHLRRFQQACRDAGLWTKDHKWAWKFEFQSDGWPHWHLFVGRKQKFTEADFAAIDRLWGLGRTNCKMIDDDEFLYEFKYAFKPALQVEEGESYCGADVAPAWFLDHLGIKTVTARWVDEDGTEHSERVIKPASFSRARFWQTSEGFYTRDQPVAEVERKPQAAWQVPFPVRVAADRLASTIQVVARDSGGTYVASSAVNLSCLTGQFWDLVGWHAFHGAAVGLGVNSYCVPAFLITSKTENQCHLQPLLHRNKLTVLAAARLQQDRQTLRTC